MFSLNSAQLGGKNAAVERRAAFVRHGNDRGKSFETAASELSLALRSGSPGGELSLRFEQS